MMVSENNNIKCCINIKFVMLKLHKYTSLQGPSKITSATL